MKLETLLFIGSQEIIIIAVIIMVPAILFYELVIVRNYADKFLPPTILSLFSNGRPRKLDKKK